MIAGAAPIGGRAQNPAMPEKTRASSKRALNKGEARDALARAGFFDRRGELHDRSFEAKSDAARKLAAR